MTKTTNKYSREVRERAVRMVLDNQEQLESHWSAILSISANIGCAPQTLIKWVKKVEVNTCQRGGITTEMAETMGLFKAKVIHRRRPCHSFEVVEYVILELVNWFNNRRLLEPIHCPAGDGCITERGIYPNS